MTSDKSTKGGGTSLLHAYVSKPNGVPVKKAFGRKVSHSTEVVVIQTTPHQPFCRMSKKQLRLMVYSHGQKKRRRNEFLNMYMRNLH
jgi:hypothetical protein